jgi:hypothetical protein
MTPDLHDVVRALTEPTYEHHFQKRDDGEGTTVTIEFPGLLEQMRQAVLPSGQNDGAGSSSAKHTRSPGDLEAMYEYHKMAAQIGSWCQMIRLRPSRDRVADLKAWYDKARSVFAPEQLDWYRRTLAGWTATIRNHLDGPEKYVPHTACPICNTTAWGDAINGGDLWPIEVRYRIEENARGEEITTGHVARCRAPQCGAVWHGWEAIEELGNEVREKQLTAVGAHPEPSASRLG